MKDVFFIIVLLALIAAIVLTFDVLVTEGQRNTTLFTHDVDIFQLNLLDQPAIAYRMLDKDGNELAVHVIPMQSLVAMTWVNNPDGLSRSDFSLSGRTIGHNLTFDQFIDAVEQAKQEIDSTEGLPTLLELHDRWEIEDQTD